MLKFKFGIVGCGVILKIYVLVILVLLSDVEFVVVCDDIEDKVRKFVQDFGVKKIYIDYEKMFFDFEIDVVFICIFLGMYVDMVVLAVDSKKYVIVEKFMDIILFKVDRIIEV